MKDEGKAKLQAVKDEREAKLKAEERMERLKMEKMKRQLESARIKAQASQHLVSRESISIVSIESKSSQSVVGQSTCC